MKVTLANELALEELEDGFRVSVRGLVDPRYGVPWLSVALFFTGIAVGMLSMWGAALPFIAIGLALYTPHSGGIVYGMEVGRGKLSLIGSETVPLHTFNRVEKIGNDLRFVGAGRTMVLRLSASASALEALAGKLSALMDELGDFADVPDALKEIKRETET